MNPHHVIRVRREFWNPRHEFSLLCAAEFPDGTFATALPLSLMKHGPEDNTTHEPAFSLDRDGATRLMDELWDAGVRPTNHGTPGQIDAMKNHLEDMRKLVFAPPES